jgi:hypothetical protein
MRGIILFLTLSFSGCCPWGACPESMPIAISTERSLYDTSTLYAAASWWNSHLGWEAVRLERGGTVEVFRVYEITGIEGCENKVGCADVRMNAHGEISSCEVFMTLTSSKKAALILAHELGHCMGLGHDSDIQGIMHASYREDQDVLQEHLEHIESCR